MRIPMTDAQDRISDLVALASGVLGLFTLRELLRNWHAFWDDTVTDDDRSLAGRLAYFVLIPVAVFFHEVGHALATWQMGGEVHEFHYRVFWGYVIARGVFTPAQDWWIAFSGNLISVALGLLAIPLIRLPKRQILREVVHTFAKAELGIALVIYPLWSFNTAEGDWARIYDFSVTPYAQVTAGVHVLLLFGLALLERSGLVHRWLMTPPAATPPEPPSPPDAAPAPAAADES